MVLWGIIPEQYRKACDELEARSAPIIKKYFMQNKCKEQNIPYEKLGLNTNSTTVNKSMASHFF